MAGLVGVQPKHGFTSCEKAGNLSCLAAAQVQATQPYSAYRKAIVCQAHSSKREDSNACASSSGHTWKFHKPYKHHGSTRQTRQVAKALFDPPAFEPAKLAATFGPGAAGDSQDLPVDRRYTLTHNDMTGDLTLTIDADFNSGQISGFYTRLLRDEVVAEWTFHPEPALHVFCHVSGEEKWLAPPAFRNYIFRREMKLVLDTFLYADRQFLDKHPNLKKAPAVIHFQSDVEELDQVEIWGCFGDRSSWQPTPTSLLQRVLWKLLPGWRPQLNTSIGTVSEEVSAVFLAESKACNTAGLLSPAPVVAAMAVDDDDSSPYAGPQNTVLTAQLQGLQYSTDTTKDTAMYPSELDLEVVVGDELQDLAEEQMCGDDLDVVGMNGSTYPMDEDCFLPANPSSDSTCNVEDEDEDEVEVLVLRTAASCMQRVYTPPSVLVRSSLEIYSSQQLSGRTASLNSFQQQQLALEQAFIQRPPLEPQWPQASDVVGNSSGNGSGSGNGSSSGSGNKSANSNSSASSALGASPSLRADNSVMTGLVTEVVGPSGEEVLVGVGDCDKMMSHLRLATAAATAPAAGRTWLGQKA